MPTYSWITLPQAQAMLAARLFDPGQVFWTPPELTTYIQEALQTWNALTSQFRAEFVFPTTQGQTWYDLSQLPGSVRPYTATDLQWVQNLEYHLLEPVSASLGAPWTGSAQFGIRNLSGALVNKVNEIIGFTNCTLTQQLVAAKIQRRTQLVDSTMGIVRVAWAPIPVFSNSGYNIGGYNEGGYGVDYWPDYAVVPLRQSDVWAKRAFDAEWLTEGGGPAVWMQSTQPPLSFDVDRVPPVEGNYDILTTQATTFGGGNPTVISVPADWVWVAKWGALSTLLGEESNAKDPLRSQYAMQRYEMGLRLLAKAPSLLEARLNNVTLGVDAVRGGDNFHPFWQNGQDIPGRLYTAGLNLVALAPAPDQGPYSVTTIVVENAPIPAQPWDYVQVNREDLVAVLDYAQHLAMFKVGGQEFINTIPLYKSFLAKASAAATRLLGMGDFSSLIYELAQLEEEREPLQARSLETSNA